MRANKMNKTNANYKIKNKSPVNSGNNLTLNKKFKMNGLSDDNFFGIEFNNK